MRKFHLSRVFVGIGLVSLYSAAMAGTYTFGTPGWVATPTTTNGGYYVTGACQYGVNSLTTVNYSGSTTKTSNMLGTYRWSFTFSPSGPNDKPVAQNFKAAVSGSSLLEPKIWSYYSPGSYSSSLSVLHAGVPTNPNLNSVAYSNPQISLNGVQGNPLGSTNATFIGYYGLGFVANQLPDGTWEGYYEWNANLAVQTILNSFPTKPSYAGSEGKAQVFYSVSLTSQ